MDGRGRIKGVLNRTKGYWSVGGILHQAQGGSSGAYRQSRSAGAWQAGRPGAVRGARVMGWNVVQGEERREFIRPI